MNILIDATPLTGGHASRGIGNYTRLLTRALESIPGLNLQVSPVTDATVAHADVVHFPFFDLFFATLPSLARPTLVTIHDVIPLQFPNKYPVGWRGRFAHFKQKRHLSRVQVIVTDSATSKRNIHEYLHVPLEKIAVVPLAANPNLYQPDHSQSEKIRKLNGLPHKYVLYVGDINYNKNVPALIKAIRGITEDIHLVLLGKHFVPSSIPEWLAIERQIAASEVNDRVHFLTDIASNDLDSLSALYAGALCYVQPSLEEGFGLPVLEAQRCGTPVVASNCGALLEIAGESTVFVEPSAQGIAGGIKMIAGTSESQRVMLIKAGLSNEQKYSWKKTAESMADLYKQAVHKV